MQEFDKIILTNDEAQVLKIMWNERPVIERKNTIDIMRLENWQRETIPYLIDKGLIQRMSIRFVRLTSTCIDFLIYLESYNIDIRKYIK